MQILLIQCRGSITKNYCIIRKSVRLPGYIYEKLVAEAKETGILKPSVQARVALIEYIQNGDLELLKKDLYCKPHTDSNERIMIIRYPNSYNGLVTSASLTVSGGKFSCLIKAILIERYSLQ